MAPISGIDHLIVGVRDLEAAHRDWQRLGFTVTPRGRHIGWGTANYCIMFPTDYLEILGIVDATQDVQGLDHILASRGEGLMTNALATDDADAVHAALTAAGIPARPPTDLARLLELPEGTVKPAFKLVHPVDAVASFRLKTFVVQHLSPALIRRDDWLRHRNSARRIIAVTAAVDDPPAVAGSYRALLGAGAVTVADGTVSVRLGGALLSLAPTTDDGVSGLLGCAIEVADLGATASCLAAASVPVDRDADGLHVDPGFATGVALSFVPA